MSDDDETMGDDETEDDPWSAGHGGTLAEGLAYLAWFDQLKLFLLEDGLDGQVVSLPVEWDELDPEAKAVGIPIPELTARMKMHVDDGRERVWVSWVIRLKPNEETHPWTVMHSVLLAERLHGQDIFGFDNPPVRLAVLDSAYQVAEMIGKDEEDDDAE